MALSCKLLLIGFSGLILASCGGAKEKTSKYPANFKQIGDAGRVAYMIRTVEPDSVARFIIYGALGRTPEAPVDTLAIATNYAYETLQGDALETFSITYDAVQESLPLGDKMRLYVLAGADDPQGVGYRLGLEYLASIRNDSKSVKEVEHELEEFRKACGKDTAMYRRFMIGFRTVLEVDKGHDIPEEIYRRFAR